MKRGRDRQCVYVYERDTAEFRRRGHAKNMEPQRIFFHPKNIKMKTKSREVFSIIQNKRKDEARKKDGHRSKQ